VRLKKLMSIVISLKQFSFLKGRQIHDTVGVAHEEIHIIKTKKSSGMVAKLDLLKAYDRVCWLYMRMLLIHIGFSLNTVNYIMACVMFVSFVVLVNGSTSPFFTLSRGLH
jgi:hypothetical protein